MITDVELFLLKPETIPEIAKKTGLPERNLDGLYDYDQSFGLVTKIVVVQHSDVTDRIEEALREAAKKWRKFTAGEKCPTCEMGQSRETKGMVCQTCGTDYGTPVSD